MSKVNSIWKFLKRNKWWSITGAVVIGGIAISSSLNGNQVIETTKAKTEDLVRVVRISGKVVPEEKVDLSFETIGTIASVPKKVGDRVSRGEVLIRLDSSSLTAEVKKAEAELSSAQAELSKLEGGAAYETSVNNAKRSIVQTMREAYANAEDAIYNKSDQLFVYPNSNRPELIASFQGYTDLRDSINAGRVEIGYLLADWKKLTQNLKVDSYSNEELSLAKGYLEETLSFVADLSRAVNLFEPNNAYDQADVDAFKADILLARNNLNSSVQAFITKEKALADFISDVPVQVARVEAAEANLLNLRFRSGKSTLASPIDGIVSVQEGKLGQAVTQGEIIVSVISPEYIIETFVPEVSIAGISLDNPASVTLDAYGQSQKFEARVSEVDPAETVRDGVSTYRVKLSFISSDERIRSGMTANVEIETMRKTGTLIIPERAVVNREGETFVYVKEGEKGQREIPVSLGEKDSYGQIEVLSGLSLGEEIIVNPPQE